MDLDNFLKELHELEGFLTNPSAFSAPDFAVKAKRATILREIIDLDARIKNHEKALAEAEELVNDPEVGEIAREDVKSLKSEIDIEIGRAHV